MYLSALVIVEIKTPNIFLKFKLNFKDFLIGSGAYICSSVNTSLDRVSWKTQISFSPPLLKKQPRILVDLQGTRGFTQLVV